MNYRGFQSLAEIRTLFGELLVPNIGEMHLDFGCGSGAGSIIQASLCDESYIVGYDTDNGEIRKAQRRLGLLSRINLDFIDSDERLRFLSPFNSATANFVFHEDPEVLATIRSYLKPDPINTFLTPFILLSSFNNLI